MQQVSGAGGNQELVYVMAKGNQEFGSAVHYHSQKAVSRDICQPLRLACPRKCASGLSAPDYPHQMDNKKNNASGAKAPSIPMYVGSEPPPSTPSII